METSHLPLETFSKYSQDVLCLLTPTKYLMHDTLLLNYAAQLISIQRAAEKKYLQMYYSNLACVINWTTNKCKCPCLQSH